MKIVSGRTGSPHVTSQQFRQMLEGILGQDSYILTSGENLEPELSSNNLLKIRSGMMCHHGCISSVEIGTYDEVGLTNGSQGTQRIDLVVNRYTRNPETEVENCEWKVIRGTPRTNNPSVPTYASGNLQNGDIVDECPVYEVHYNGINVTEVKKLLSVQEPLAELKREVGTKVDIQRLSLGSTVFTGQYLGNKPIYLKLIDCGALPNRTTKTVSTGLSGLDYFWIDPSNSFAFNSGAAYPIPYADSSYSNSLSVRLTGSGSNIVIGSGSDWSGYSCIIGVRFTRK